MSSSRHVSFAAHQEWANTITHAFGFVLSLISAAHMISWFRHVDQGTALACGVYLVTLVMVYAVSTLSHAIKHPHRRHIMRIWDQAWIYALISGTYTPFVWNFLSGSSRWALLIALWTAAFVGLITKVVVQYRINSTTTYSYILLGWLPSIPLMPRVSWNCLMWMAAGGVIYTLGTIFLKMERRHVYFHAVWHILVIIASGIHYAAILVFVVHPRAAS